ncbi:inositol monophosphatase family protein [Furfurilactobacillus siliginis]|uniref:Fructose 1,6-bisphosphatase n=1 Tax=Furfurilactobacillus siliginis TaxID=348151 RepID=A0A0R2LAW9_9LACO|nr:inositol monophosphatase family protein [Furfurilactobacillus siliginis]KRN96234.1 myo-inositol monophosphatase [Furfurilactobacillus siliginis]GEK27841.1 fructose 1,6-bisphosphatase [Furfurilactobacillus siliginis]
MNQQKLAQLSTDVTGWLISVGEKLRPGVKAIETVDTKSSRNDLVTNEDVAIEDFLEQQIHEHYPEARIVGEENKKSRVQDLDGLVFFVDPIDGTLNFVRKHDCFASMIGVYENGEPVFGAILDVMENDLYWGGPQLGVFCNEEKLPSVDDKPLAEGLIGASWRQLFTNRFNLGTVGYHASGVRILGSAGLEFVQLLHGRHVGYVSTLNPWDIAAGKILAEALGYKTSTVAGQKVNLLHTCDFVVMTPKAMKEFNALTYA